MRKLIRLYCWLILTTPAGFAAINSTDSLCLTGELLGRPTDRSVTVNLVPAVSLELYAEFGTASGDYFGQTAVVAATAGVPIELVLEPLQLNSRYFYRLCPRQPGESDFQPRVEHSFHTQRPRSSTFTFAVQADPHLDEQSNAEVYRQTMANTRADQPDFLIDLGDNFMSDKIAEIYPGQEITRESIRQRHLLLRQFYDLAGYSVPLLLVLGNHEGELGWYLDGTAENIAVWATNIRKMYFPNPAPDGFFSGDATEYDFVGQRESYYAWEWGDALLVVLDPFWFSTTKPGKTSDNWDWTLGKQQYSWLKNTLETSTATFKFIFCHHLVGGRDSEARGGSEYAGYFEWGGLNADGSWGFDEKRPGWERPIHQLLVENQVTIFFHGHDHFFARQELDGVVYQLVPQPSHPNYKRAGAAANYGYVDGDILPNSGHLRVTVSPETVRVEYVRAFQAADESPGDGRVNGSIDFSYTLIPPKGTTAPDETRSRIEDFQLLGNFPNPFNLVTTIRFRLPRSDRVALKIFDLQGRTVGTLVDAVCAPGEYSVAWPAQGVASGIYFCRLQVGRWVKMRKLVVEK